MALEDFLEQTATLLAQQAGVTDGFGGVDREPYSAIAANLPCLVRPLSGTNQRRNDKAELLMTHRIYFDQDWGFLASRRITVDGRVFVVVSPVNYNSLGALIAVDCLEVVE